MRKQRWYYFHNFLGGCNCHRRLRQVAVNPPWSSSFPVILKAGILLWASFGSVLLSPHTQTGPSTHTYRHIGTARCVAVVQRRPGRTHAEFCVSVDAISDIMSVVATPCPSSSLMSIPAVLVDFLVMHGTRHAIRHRRLVVNVIDFVWWVVSALDAYYAWLAMYDV